MGTNSTGCTEWERDFDHKTEQPAMRSATDLRLIYRIREALGFNQYYPLSNLDSDAKQMRQALLACAPLAFGAIAEEKKNEIGNSDLDNEQPITLTIRTTLGAVREARRALFVANVPALTRPERGDAT